MIARREVPLRGQTTGRKDGKNDDVSETLSR